MKTSTIPATRVTPELRAQVDDILQNGETLSSFLIESLQLNLHRRKAKDEFIAKGLASRDEAKITGQYVAATDVIDNLRAKLNAAQLKQP